MTADPRWHDAWERALDRLELDVATAERMLRAAEPAVPTPWRAPEVEGTMPAELAFRAQQILARQQIVLAAIGKALESTRRQQALTSRIRESHLNAEDRPVYLDVNA